MRIYWGNFWAFSFMSFLGAVLATDELMGIAHVWNLNPITEDAEQGLAHGNPALFFLLFAIGLIYLAWWPIHIWDHRLKK